VTYAKNRIDFNNLNSFYNINTGDYDEKINQKGISKICQKAWSKLVAKIKKLLE
jgi:hypothetical protein